MMSVPDGPSRRPRNRRASKPERQIKPRWEALARWAEVVGSDLQPWPRYFSFRARELSAALTTRDFHRNVLEVGCGVGFASALLGIPGRRIMALDLPREDAESHSIGMSRAAELRRRLELPCPPLLVAGDGARLPVPDESMDLVVSVYALEHIPDRDAVCREIHRVLKPGGEAIILVPGAAERIWAPAWYYLHTFVELMGSIRSFFRRLPGDAGAVSASAPRSHGPTTPTPGRPRGWRCLPHFWSRFRHHYPRFPAVPPHGAYSGSWEEFRSCRASSWAALFEDAGLVVRDHRATMLAPVALLEEFSPGLREWVTRKLHGMTFRWGRSRLFRTVAHGGAWYLSRGESKTPVKRTLELTSSVGSAP